MKIFFVGISAFVIFAEAIALVTAGMQDQGAFLFWTGFAAVASCFVGSLFIKLTKNLPNKPVYVACVIAGGLLGVGWTYFVMRALGPWFGAFGIPIVFSWIVGGGTSFVAMKAYVEFPFKKFLGVTTGAAVGLTAFYIFLSLCIIQPSLRYSLEARTLTLYSLQYIPGSDPLFIDEHSQLTQWGTTSPLTEKEKQTLRARYPTGFLMLQSNTIGGEGPATRAIIVVERPILENLVAKEPKKGTVFYFQTEKGFEPFPPNVELLKREFSFYSQQSEWKGTKYIDLTVILPRWDSRGSNHFQLMRWEMK